MGLEMAQPEGIWYNSNAIDLTTSRPNDCFTTLPVRLSKRDDLANSHSTQAIKDWTATFGNSADIKIGQTFSPGGNVTSLMWPECSPDKLPILAWMMQFAYIYDDVSEVRPLDKAEMKTALKHLVVHKVRSAVDTNTEAGRLFLGSFQTWAEQGHSPHQEAFKSVDDYLAFRLHNSGMKCYWDWIAFSSGYILTSDEWDSIRHILRTATAIYILTNDYFSWYREKLYEQDRVVNVVNLYMGLESLSEEGSMEKTKQEILRYEQQLREQCAEMDAQGLTVPDHVKNLLQLIEVSMGGYHYWASTCLRFNFWKYFGLSPNSAFCSVDEEEAVNATKDEVSSFDEFDMIKAQEVSSWNCQEHQILKVWKRYSSSIGGYGKRAMGLLKGL